MTEKDKTILKRYGWMIPIVLMVAAWFSGDYYGQKMVRESLESKVDTVTKIVTVYKDFPEPQKTALVGYLPVPTYKFITDTINAVKWREIHDTTVVYLPREQRYYEEEDGKLKMWVSGYDPRVDRYEISWPETTVTQTIVQKPRRWHISVQFGYGVTFANGTVKAGPTLSGGVSYSLLSF